MELLDISQSVLRRRRCFRKFFFGISTPSEKYNAGKFFRELLLMLLGCSDFTVVVEVGAWFGANPPDASGRQSLTVRLLGREVPAYPPSRDRRDQIEFLAGR